MPDRRLGAFLSRHRLIALDTSPFIYHLQHEPQYARLTDELFSWIERGRGSAVTSTLTMVELLVRPFRDHSSELVDLIYALLVRYPNLTWISPSLEIADRAARLRAQHNLRTPDAIQAATALGAGATGLVTNDRAMTRVEQIDIFVLDRAQS